MRTTQKFQMLFILIALALSACGSKDGKKETKLESQVVAKVNDKEISIHQINYQLGKLGEVDESQSKDVAKQILARLVDQQVLKEKAIEVKLDRDPNVVQAIEAMKDQLLAQAYLEQQMNKVAKPSDAEIKDFYQQNPLLFENRHIYRLQELVIRADKNQVDEVRNNVSSMKSMSDIAAWLKSKNYLFNANTNVRSAEQLPMNLLKKLSDIKDGEVVVMDTSQTINIVHLVASKLEPIDLAKAKPFIQQYLLNQDRNKAASAELKQLKGAAKIQYMGQFSDFMAESKGLPTQSVAANQNPASQAKSKSENVSMDKGLSGL